MTDNKTRQETKPPSPNGCPRTPKPANSSAGYRSSETSSPVSLVQSFRRRRGGIISMFRMRVHGVCLSFFCVLGKLVDKEIAHRTLITRKLKGLEDIIPVTSVHWHMGEKGNQPFPTQMND